MTTLQEIKSIIDELRSDNSSNFKLQVLQKHKDNEDWKKWAKFGCLGVEMEAAALYTIAAKFGVNALALLTVSDHFVTGEVTSAEERQLTFTTMMDVALETIIKLDK